MCGSGNAHRRAYFGNPLPCLPEQRWQMSFRGGQERKAGKPVKKISVNPVSKDTLESSVSEYVCVVEENIVTVRNVRQSHICPGVFYISENFLKKFWKDPSKRAFPFGERMKGSLCLLFLPVGTGRG